MVITANHGGEAGRAGTLRTGMAFALVEEGMADAPPAPGGQQHAFAEIEQAHRVDPARFEGGAEFGLLVDHRGRCGRADHRLASESADQHGIGAATYSAR